MDTPTGWVVALPDAAASRELHRRVMLGLLGSMLGGMLLTLTLIGIPCGMVLMFAPMVLLFQGTRVWSTVEVGPAGVTLGHAFGSDTQGPTVSDLRRPGKAPIAAQALARRTLPFSEIEAIGHTDYSLYFRMADGRSEELLLERTRHEDIAALRERVEGVWKRVRAGIDDTSEAAAAARARLQQVTRKI